MHVIPSKHAITITSWIRLSYKKAITSIVI